MLGQEFDQILLAGFHQYREVAPVYDLQVQGPGILDQVPQFIFNRQGINLNRSLPELGVELGSSTGQVDSSDRSRLPHQVDALVGHSPVHHFRPLGRALYMAMAASLIAVEADV